MSIEFRVKITCDAIGCRKSVNGISCKSTEVVMMYALAKQKAYATGWVTIPRGSHPTSHYCRNHSEPVIREMHYAKKKKNK